MKTQIIQCDGFDDLRSLLDRLKWVKARRALLVFPVNNPPSLSKLDLTLLSRKATSLQFELGFVSSDPIVKHAVQLAGLPVFASIEESRQTAWNTGHPRTPVKHHRTFINQRLAVKRPSEHILPGWVRWLAFGLAALAVITLLAALLPGAKVELNLPRGEQSGVLVVPAGTNRPVSDLIAGIPLYQLSLEVSANIQQETTGRVPVGDIPASGLVEITNLTDLALIIPSDAVVRSLEPAYRYKVKQSGNLPARSGSTISLPVEEMDGNGSDGNLPAGAIVAMDPPLGLSVSVTNPEALSGGTLKTSPALAQADLLAADNAIEKALALAFIQKVPTSMPENAGLIQDSIVQGFLRETSTPPSYDRPLLSFDVNNVAEMTGTYYLESDLEQWAELALDASLIAGQIEVPGSLEVEILSTQYLSGTEAYITIRTTRQTIPEFDPASVAVALRGLKPESALKMIRTQLFPGSQPQITHNPGWWGWLPFIPMRITIDG
ncbi:MAG: hypothetical protein WBV22_13195 [Anaerolineaceae bacterium]